MMANHIIRQCIVSCSQQLPTVQDGYWSYLRSSQALSLIWRRGAAAMLACQLAQAPQ